MKLVLFLLSWTQLSVHLHWISPASYCPSILKVSVTLASSPVSSSPCLCCCHQQTLTIHYSAHFLRKTFMSTVKCRGHTWGLVQLLQWPLSTAGGHLLLQKHTQQRNINSRLLARAMYMGFEALSSFFKRHLLPAYIPLCIKLRSDQLKILQDKAYLRNTINYSGQTGWLIAAQWQLLFEGEGHTVQFTARNIR